MKLDNFSKNLNLLKLFFDKKDENKIFELYCYELLQSGNNVKRDSLKYDIDPHIYNEKMLNFYSKSSAFIFELIVDSIRDEKISKDKFIINKINTSYKRDEEIRILCFGDGIGTDSLNFASHGRNVTYFDVEGQISNFASLNFKFNGVSNLIRRINDENLLKENSFDVIICREVLEHLEDPFDTVTKLRSYLKNNGLYFISESFSSVSEQFPTHLRSNLKYVEKNIELTIKTGFKYLETFNNTNLNVFKKVSSIDNSRFLSLPIIPLKQRIKKGLRAKINYLLS